MKGDVGKRARVEEVVYRGVTKVYKARRVIVRRRVKGDGRK